MASHGSVKAAAVPGQRNRLPQSPAPKPLCPHCRFERPDSRNRWDSPLFTVHPLLGPEHTQRELEAVVAAVTEQGAKQGPKGAPRGPVAKELVPNVATVCGPAPGQ